MKQIVAGFKVFPFDSERDAGLVSKQFYPETEVVTVKSIHGQIGFVLFQKNEKFNTYYDKDGYFNSKEVIHQIH